jgi:hypothetical protein
MNEKIPGIKAIKEVKKAGIAVKKRMFSYIAAGLGLVAGLAWNDAVGTLISYLIPKSDNTVVAKMIYAFVVTLVVAVLLFYIEKSLNRDE